VVELLLMMVVAKVRRTKVLWTIHNLSAHEERHPRLARWFARALVRMINGYVCLTRPGQALALQRYPGLARLHGFVVPHGHYRDVYPDRLDRTQARARLGLQSDAVVFVFVGQVRPYKGVDCLCRAFREVRSDRARLVVAGSAEDNMAAAVRAAAGDDARITFEFAFIQDADLQVYLRAADLVVLPYVDVLNSGSALLALSFDVPILVPGTTTFQELREAIGTAWVLTYDGPITAHALSAAMAAVQSTPRVGRPVLDSLAWPRIAQQTLDAMLAVAAPTERVRRSPSESEARATPTR
jgi:glycosyltransferase involved in cell wall biosynthesis